MKKDDTEILNNYSKICIADVDEYMKENNLSTMGLSEKEVEERIKKYGVNEVKTEKQKKWYNYFFQSLFSPFNSILLGIALILCYTDIVLAEKPSYANIVVIVTLVLISTILEFFEEYKSNRAAEKLKEFVATTTNVIRNGKEIKITLNNIAKGDIVKLSAGDMIPADLKIIEAKDLFVRQSSLTRRIRCNKEDCKFRIKRYGRIYFRFRYYLFYGDKCY